MLHRCCSRFRLHTLSLQLRTPGGDYVPAKPVPDTVLVMIDDLMQRWTSDKLVSTVRVTFKAASLILSWQLLKLGISFVFGASWFWEIPGLGSSFILGARWSWELTGHGSSLVLGAPCSWGLVGCGTSMILGVPWSLNLPGIGISLILGAP